MAMKGILRFKYRSGELKSALIMEGMLIEKVRNLAFLYDAKSGDYRDQEMRTNAWEDIGKKLKIYPGLKAQGNLQELDELHEVVVYSLETSTNHRSEDDMNIFNDEVPSSKDTPQTQQWDHNASSNVPNETHCTTICWRVTVLLMTAHARHDDSEGTSFLALFWGENIKVLRCPYTGMNPSTLGMRVAPKPSYPMIRRPSPRSYQHGERDPPRSDGELSAQKTTAIIAICKYLVPKANPTHNPSLLRCQDMSRPVRTRKDQIQDGHQKSYSLM
uniref:MADF domain-containing protein n=1 Tax=Timema tahoe TaxID=61484 RepID=A0A7R9IKR2_9NEOP|nr:unnamed protein product [Timema tahoe]